MKFQGEATAERLGEAAVEGVQLKLKCDLRKRV